MSTSKLNAEQRVRLTIGDLVVQNITMSHQLEQVSELNAALSAELASLKKSVKNDDDASSQ